MPSILKHGLGWSGATQNWPGAERGIYLTEDPASAFAIMVERYLEHGEPTSKPAEELAAICIIVIDNSRIPRARLGPDPSIPLDGIWLYRGLVDVRGMPVIGADDLVRAPGQPL